MRALAAVALASLSLVAAGCGATAAGFDSSASGGTGAANLVPADAGAFASIATDVGSSQWQRLDALTKDFPARSKLLDRINAELQKQGLTWKDDVAPALGPETDVALIGGNGVVFTKPGDGAKLKALADKLSTGNEHYTVQQLGGWSVVADTQAAFDAVHAAQGGQSLADSATFKTAWAHVDGDALVRAYANGAKLASLPRLAKLGGAVQWAAARVRADGDALRLEAFARPTGAAPATTAQPLLRDVPSGASLAVAFHGSADLAQKLAAAAPAANGFSLATLAPLVSGDGVLYVRAAGLVPDIAIELAAADPQQSLSAARAALTSLGGALGPVPLTAQLSNGKVVIADGPAAVDALRSGPKLTGDQAYKDAIQTAGVPARTTFLAYADVTQLAPFIQLAAGALAQSSGGKPVDPSLGDNLAHVGTVVAWGSSENGLARLSAWIRPR